MLVLRCTNQSGVKADLDVLEQIDIKVDISAIEVGDIGEVFGVSSQAFALPATKNNQDFFGYLDDLGATPSVGFINTIPCQVLNDGIEIFSGKLYIDDVITNQRGDTTYQVVVVNETVDFTIAVKNLQIQDLDFSDLDHAYTYANISASWSDNLLGGRVVYPMVDYGVDSDNASSTEVAAGGEAGKFDNSTTPLQVTDFKPAIRASYVLEKMFDAVGFGYTSSFIEDAYFESLYILSTQDDKPGSSFTNPVSQSFQAYATGSPSQTISPYTATTVSFPSETFDNGNNFDTTLGKYYAASDGNYTFYSLLRFNEDTNVTYNDFRQVRFEIHVNGVMQQASLLNCKWIAPSAIRTMVLGPTGLSLTTGDEVTIVVTYQAIANDLFVQADTRFEGIGPSTVLGGNVTMNNIFDPKTKVVDILKGLTQKFNLVIEPVEGSRNLLSIETFNEWIDLGTTIDWTSKIDRNVKFKIQHPLQTQPKTLEFTDVEDVDPINAYNKANFERTYGEFTYTSDSDLASGQKKIGTYFSPTPYKGIAGAPQFVIPRLTKKETNQADSPLKFKPRLLHKVGMKDNPIQLRGNYVPTNTFNPGTFFIQDEVGGLHYETKYMHFSHLSEFPANYNTTKDLHFGNTVGPGHWPYHQNEANGYALHSAFYDYWSFYVNEMYDIDARLLTCNVILDPSELPSLRLNSKIFIDGQYYRIDKINGASLLNESSVEVKLLKTAPRKNRYPRRRIIDIYTGEKLYDIISNDPGLNGFVSYSNYDTGVDVKGQNVINAALKDGYLSYVGGDEIVWEPDRVNPLNVTNNTIQGNNTVDQSADKVLISGDFNIVYESVRNSSVVGNNNTLEYDTTLSNISGIGNTVGEGATNVQIVGGSDNIILTASFADSIGLFNTTAATVNSSSLSTIVGGYGQTMTDAAQSTIIGGVNMSLSNTDNPVVVIGGDNVAITGGNNHVVIGKDDEITGSLNLDNYRYSTNVLNGTYLDNDLYLNRDGFQISASAGGYTYAYSGEGLYKWAYEVDWSGSAGAAHTIELPGVISQEQYGRTILIKAGANITGSKAVDITVVGGGKIDGQSTFTLDEAYSFVELRASEYYTLGGEARDVTVEWRIIGSSTATAGGGGSTPPFPYIGDARITGSLSVTGSVNFNAEIYSTFLSSSRSYVSSTSASLDGVQNGQVFILQQSGTPPIAGYLMIMLNSGSAEIVTTDLRCYVNANDPTSYPGSGATWYDLSGNGRDLTLDATPTFELGTPNYFNFTDGTDAASYKPGGILDSLTSQGDEYTVMMFMAIHNSSAGYRTFIRDVNGSTANDFLITNTGTNTMGTYGAGFATLGINVVTDIPSYSTVFNGITMTMDDGGVGDDVKIYLNGSATPLGSNNTPLRYDGPGVFGNQGTGAQPGAKIAAILVYDRVLSTAEIQQNYNALATQMGL